MRKTQKVKSLLILFILIVALILLNVVPSLSNWLGNFVFKISSPVGGFFIRTGDRVVGFFEILISIKGLTRENIELRKKNLELETEITQLKEVDRENEILRQGLQISEKSQFVMDIALVTGKDIQGGSQDWILINRGTKYGAEKDMAVISPEMALVGKIIETTPDFSKVMLITNKDSIVAALIEGERSEGLVKKEEKGKLFMDFIPRSEKIDLEERILTSGMDNIYPKGILIGKIENIDLSQNQLFQKITISLAVDFSKLEEVFIVK